MSDELNEAVEQTEIELTQADLDSVDEESTAQEAAPASEEAEEIDSESEENEDKPKKLTGEAKRIATLTARNYQMRQELEALKAQKSPQATATAEADEKPPVVPDYPDEDLKYDNPAEYKKQLAERDQALVDLATWKATQAIQVREQTARQQEVMREAQLQRDEIVTAYIENGVQAGVSEKRMAENEQVLKEVGVNQDLAFFLYSDTDGARLIDYLAANPDELATLSALHPTQAAVKIATVIKPKALAKKPHATKAPDPATPSRGTARRENEWDTVAQGATFS
jgi:hypothetical protein